MNWHQLDTQKVIQETGSSDKGLSASTAQQLLAENGPNELVQKKKKPAWLLFLHQFTDFMIIILLAAAVIAGVAGDLADTIIILVIVLLNAVLGFVQEYRAEKAMEALRKMAAPEAAVLRDGQRTSIPAAELVPGDLVLLEAGVLVPADLRLLESHSLRIEESSLTGESAPVDKDPSPIDEEDLPLGDRLNMAYKSTQVANGRGSGIVIATGMKTEIGKIAGMLQGEDPQTPLRLRLADFGKKITWLVIGICVLLFGVGLLRGEEPVNMLLVAISLAVAAIPEALPALITIALARGARRLVKQNVLIRKLPAVETLGSVSYICSDKTGTLTRNKMTVTGIVPFTEDPLDGQQLSLLEASMVLNQDAVKKKEGGWTGDPTEIALIEYIHGQHDEQAAEKTGREFPRVGELPFDSDRKRMTTIHQQGDRYLVIVKGATEALLDILQDQGATEKIKQETDRLAKEGNRVLAYGYRYLDQLPSELSVDDIEKELQFSGLAGMIDPPREGVKEAIAECKKAGIRTVMITGDHPTTAAAIAREIGILEEKDIVMSGRELGKLSPEELGGKVEQIAVYARVSPEQKLNIVKALQGQDHFVAMTGDGVNDAPSLRTANIGIAMGITGTDVSKEAAHMILLDDKFTTIVGAVKEGRRIYDNIRKFVKYIMTCNSAEIWTIFFAPLLGLPVPLLPVHILWINLVTDGLPGLTLSSEQADKDIMQRKPRRTNESLFAGGLGYHIIWVGILMAALTLGTQAWAIHIGDAHWQTMVFTVLSLAQLGHVLAIRSDTEFIYKKGFLSNKPLIGSLVLTFGLQLGVIYLPFANDIFHTQPLTGMELLACVGVAAFLFHAVEFEKLVRRWIAKK
ncbi:MAG: cation-translocating P-type ATPase [Candidatus Pseudobacter hemicellulosilyticus]|uniref:Cation-translocating P-type ATPase n=1 Tax=Candidatus Pseudobacter hemicellulosilyticus TaxID=3121375 RepID=A0AAJ6BEC7_9BACT|nr:MAG: cation-translocating P-type ATPase [Pseudobacter sp.]